MNKPVTINTTQAPGAIGTYSQAIQYGNLVFLSGQIPLDPETMEIIDGDFSAQAQQVFSNLRAVCIAAGGDLGWVLKLTVYLADMADFPTVNEVMARNFKPPYPARAAIQVAALPKDARIEVDAVMAIKD